MYLLKLRLQAQEVGKRVTFLDNPKSQIPTMFNQAAQISCIDISLSISQHEADCLLVAIGYQLIPLASVQGPCHHIVTVLYSLAFFHEVEPTGKNGRELCYHLCTGDSGKMGHDGQLIDRDESDTQYRECDCTKYWHDDGVELQTKRNIVSTVLFTCIGH